MDQIQHDNTQALENTTTVLSRKGKKWSEEEDDALLFALHNGVLFDDIATTHRRTVVAITMRVLMHAVKAVDGGLSVEVASDMFRLPAARISEGITKQPRSPKCDVPSPSSLTSSNSDLLIKGKRKAWTAQEDTVLLNQLNSDMSIQDIATAHDRTIGAVNGHISSLAINSLDKGTSFGDVSRVHRLSEDKLNQLIANRTKINANRTEISAKRTEISAKRTEINANRAKINANRAEINANRTKINANRTEINLNQLDAAVSDAEGPISTRRGKRWSPEEDEHLGTRLLSGMSIAEIAIAHQRTVSAISVRLLMYAVAAINNGMSLEDAVRIYRLPADKITRAVNKEAKSHKRKVAPVITSPRVNQLQPLNNQDVLIEIRDLLRILVGHLIQNDTAPTNI